MKSTVLNIVFTYGASITILSLFSLFIGLETITVIMVFELLGANIIMHLGILLLHKLETPYLFLEYIIDTIYIIIVLIIFWKIFNWYLIPFWLIVASAVVVYIFTIILEFKTCQKETKMINELLKKRDENIENSAS